MKNKKIKIHERGSIGEMVAIALPMVVSASCDTIMVFTDRLFLARLGPEMMNAAMGGGLTSFMMMSFFLGLTGYSTALVAQYLGAGRKKNCAGVISQAAIISLAAYPVMLALRPLGHMLFEASGAAPSQLVPQKLYFNILLWASVIGLLRNSISSFFSGTGRTAVVMAASITAMAVNVCLNYVLIYGKFGVPAMGIRGAAYGTVAGGLCGLAVLAAVYFSKENLREYHIPEALRFDRIVMKKLLRLGSSVGAEMFLNILAFNLMVFVFYSRGPVTATAATVMFNWDMVSFVPLVGVEIGVTSLVGRCMGAGDPATAQRSVQSGLKLGLVYSAFILALFAGFPNVLVKVFRPEVADSIFASAEPTASFMIRFASLYVLTEALLVVYIGALRGAGDTLWAMGMSVSMHWASVGVLALMLSAVGATAEAAWTVMVAMFILFSGVVILRYRSGKWKSIRVVHPEPVLIPGESFHETPDI
ncbi:MAG TPA: MATE family efflux transporter [Candidatus Omnitrophota bacterium]|nr:MATE family efflux transporter [Candidatus Omnitrophota bacterium]